MTLEMLTVGCGETSMSRTQVQLWYNRFKEGLEDVNNDARSGRQRTSTTEENIEAVNRMIIVETLLRRFSIDVGISFGSCKAIFTDILGMKRAAEEIFTNLLNFVTKTTSHRHRLGDVDDDLAITGAWL